ncbi:glycosyltransferase involved in cell wall biosynthesis [Winogradskyella wandonensis]|uniref:Glycosyltransferase involved in cell wall biosynthesis n=1 Tax=Winogradskyella wandonensis TaxID=1442586 RepID=A0A4R1KPB2_9FLAO|nr:glycosyltransferase [Winogradskyella wandonensis]TCK66838.1 glycosyltransferase involved in cell wall biosynthesis [Winogradskyella wandonensis]
MTKKVGLLIDRLASGGAEKMTANLSKSLVALGYNVTTIIMQNHIDYDYAGNLYNFGEIKSKHSKIKAFRLFKNYVRAQSFDVILDHRVRTKWLKEFIFSRFVFKNSRVIYCVHHYDLSLYFPLVTMPFLSKYTLVKNREIIVVSKLAKSEIKKQLGLDSFVIYNYPIINESKPISVDYDYVIAVGRLEKIKQFDVLITCYKASRLPENDIKLLIFGEGSERDTLNRQIEEQHLGDLVFLKGFDTNVAGFIEKAKALVLSSHSEGFPMVLIEAIQLITPVISFDCKSGPSEIIEQGINGLLVKNQDENELINALNKLLDTDFYDTLTQNLRTYISPFTEEKALQQWISLIEV